MVKIKSIYNKNEEFYKAFIDIDEKPYSVVILTMSNKNTTHHCVVFDSNMDIVFESDVPNASEKIMLSCIYSCANQLTGIKYDNIESAMNDALSAPIEAKEQAFAKFNNRLDQL